MLQASQKTELIIPFEGFNPGDKVVRLFEDHLNDNRIYVVQGQHGSYYCGRTEISSLYGHNDAFMIDTTKLRPAHVLEELNHCRLYQDTDVDVTILLGG